jgi:endonuclease/exonuclease/phosphatase family metal-dependent hydrolase
MRLASYNVENLFMRARAMNGDTLAEGADALAAHAEINAILSKPKYEKKDKTRIVQLMKLLGINKSDDGGPFAILRQNRGHLAKRSQGKIEIVADGRADWIGFVELKMEAVNEVATRMTAKVIHEIDADVLGLVEAENRPSLLRFNRDVMKLTTGTSYDHIMLVDGNDERGIDVAIMTRAGFDLEAIRSHVDDEENGKRIFSRDCAEYHIRTPGNHRLIILVNHFKSKGFGSAAESNRKREMQARRVKAIYENLRQGGAENVAVVGDLNDTPGSGPLGPLASTGLKDISEHPNFNDNGRPGTYANGTASNKIDYVLLSPALFQKARGGQIFRMGVWGGKNGTLFPHFPEITRAEQSASDHAAIFADIDI